jgi:hypothetical protein
VIEKKKETGEGEENSSSVEVVDQRTRSMSIA